VAQRATVGAFGVGQPHGIPGIHLQPARVRARLCGGSGVVSRM
jgi:hypothetical protein